MRKQGRSAESHLGLPEYRGHSSAEKTAFAGLILFIAAAMAGAFGDGPASDAHTASDDGRLQIEYQRFLRRQAPQVLSITLPTSGRREVELTIDREYLRDIEIDDVFPEPISTTTHATSRLTFATEGRGSEMTVWIHFKPLYSGSLTGKIASTVHGTARFDQFVYP